jgi:Transposase and inactivated derivatives
MRLTEAQYKSIQYLLPVQKSNVKLSSLDVLNALFHVAETDCPWREFPEE